MIVQVGSASASTVHIYLLCMKYCIAVFLAGLEWADDLSTPTN